MLSLSCCLPSFSALRSRQVEVDTLYPMCSNMVESDFHSLIKYWWNKLQRQCANDQLDSAAMLLWYIWLNRNMHVWNNKQQPSAAVV
ncbi:hypothetical protein LguiA_029267 [Lonicera macranthoides]